MLKILVVCALYDTLLLQSEFGEFVSWDDYHDEGFRTALIKKYVEKFYQSTNEPQIQQVKTERCQICDLSGFNHVTTLKNLGKISFTKSWISTAERRS